LYGVHKMIFNFNNQLYDSTTTKTDTTKNHLL